jgi:hypothetical protein
MRWRIKHVSGRGEQRNDLEMFLGDVMRKTLLAIAFILLAIPAFGQSTTVSGQITDAGSQAWSAGTFQFLFVPNPQYPASQYTWTGGAFNPNQPITGTMNGSGAYSVSIPSNTAISPINSQWLVKFCPQANPAQCYTTAAVTITGSTQTLNATPPAIQVQPGALSVAYSDSEIVGFVEGSIYWNVTIPALRIYDQGAWVTAGGGGGGGGTVTSVSCVSGCTVANPTTTPAITVTAGGSGTVTSFSSGNLSPLFTTSVATATTTPAQTFTASTAAQNSFLAGPSTGGTGAYSFRSIVIGDLPTSGATAGSYTNSNVTVNAQGIITSISNGSGGSSVFPLTVSGTVNSGGIPCFNSTTNEESSAALTANTIVLGGGAGACVSSSTALPNGTTATTQTTGDNTTKIATDAFVIANAAGAGVASVQYGSNTALTGAIIESFGLGMAAPSQASQTVTIACNAATTSVIGCLSLGGALSGSDTSQSVNLGAGATITGSLPHANIAATAVTPGSYTNTNLTVAADGSITAASNGSGGGGLSGQTTGCLPLAASATTSTSSSSVCDNGTTVSTTEALSALSLATTGGANPGLITFPGNTGTPTIGSNLTGIEGPSSATFTSYVLQLPTTAPATATPLLSCNTPSSNISACSFVANGGGSSGLSGMTAGQVPIAATATTVTSSKAIVGTDSGLASAATISTTAGTPVCSTANGGVTTTSCTPLTVAEGGTGLATLTSNAIYKGAGTSNMAVSSLTDSGSILQTSDVTFEGPASNGFVIEVPGNSTTYNLQFKFGSAPSTNDQFGGTAAGTSNAQGAETYLTSGLSTGTGALAQFALKGTVKGTTGSTTQTAVNRSQTNLQTTLTNATATTFLTVANASNTTAGGLVKYCVHADNGTDFQSSCGEVTYSVVNKAGTTTTNVGTVGLTSSATSSGTITMTFAFSGNALQATNTSTVVTPTNVLMTWSVENFSDANDITVTSN